MTAAHKSLPFGTVVKVVDQRTGKSIRVTINDRGPYIGGRIIDLSKAAATKLGFRGRGTTKVCITQV
jgi:rare lipoprotein A